MKKGEKASEQSKPTREKQKRGGDRMNALGQSGTVALPSTFAGQEEDTAMTILRRPITRELTERIAHRQMVVEFHPGFVRFREKRSRTAWDISWESIYWKAAEIQGESNGLRGFAAGTIPLTSKTAVLSPASTVKVSPHSCRSATIGSIFVARREGM